MHPLGVLRRRTRPSRLQCYTYTQGRLTKISGFVNFIGYHANGMVAHISHANNTTYQVDVDASAMRRPKNIRLSVPGLPTLAFGDHAYDGAGNLMVRGPEYFLYDQVSRITRYQRGDGTFQTYGFDTFGNLEAITTFDGSAIQPRTFAINRRKNRLSSASYDARGNLFQWSDQDYRFDEVDMLIQKEFPWETYIYTADDERVLTIRYDENAVNILREGYTLRDIDGKLLRTYHTEGGSKGRWFWGDDYIHDDRGLPMVDVSTKAFPQRNKHYHHDHLGTPVVITDQQGTIIATDILWAFGEPVVPNATFTSRRFTSHERDYSPAGRTFDLDYMHARHYLPHMGRFMTVDPIGGNPSAPQSWNQYSYGLGNPIKYIDPLGLAAVDSCAQRDENSLSCSGEISVIAAEEKQQGSTGASTKSGLNGAGHLFLGRLNLNALSSVASTDLRRERLRHCQKISA